MKWKLFQLSAIINLTSVAGFFILVVYVLNLPTARTDTTVLFLLVLGAMISAARDFIGLYYVNQYHSGNIFTGKYRVSYIIFGIIQTLVAVAIGYSLARMFLGQYQRIYWSNTLILWQSALFVYAVSSVCMTVLDFFILPALHKKTDPSEGILEEEQP